MFCDVVILKHKEDTIVPLWVNLLNIETVEKRKRGCRITMGSGTQYLLLQEYEEMIDAIETQTSTVLVD